MTVADPLGGEDEELSNICSSQNDPTGEAELEYSPLMMLACVMLVDLVACIIVCICRAGWLSTGCEPPGAALRARLSMVRFLRQHESKHRYRYAAKKYTIRFLQ